MQLFPTLIDRFILSWLPRIALGLSTSIFMLAPVRGSTVIERAEIYKIRNQVDLNLRNRPNWLPAKLGDTLVPQDAVRTGTNSRADILFNEGTLVRTGAGTTFRFPPGKRSFELTSGAAIIMIRPEQGQSTINTPEAKVVTQGTALFVQRNPENSSSLVGVLTNSPAGLVEVSSADGKVTLKLQAGQFVSIVNGIVGFVEHFALPVFYETVDLAAGLGTNPQEIEKLLAPESPEVQTTIRAVRAEAIDPLRNQIALLQNFCQLGTKTQNLANLMQILGISPTETKVKLEQLETDLAVTPLRSLGGIAWLKQYCQGNPILPGFEPDNLPPKS